MKRALKIWHELTGEIFALRKSSRVIQLQIDCLRIKKPKVTYEDYFRPMLPKSVLIGYLDQEQSRRRTIEEKAKTNVLAITIAASAMIAGVAVASEVAGIHERCAGWIVWPVVVAQGIGIIFLLAGGIVALNALRVAETYMWTLGREKMNMTIEAINAELSWCLQFNQCVTSIKSNQVETSYICIRNGIIALGLAALLMAVLLLSPSAFSACEKNPEEVLANGATLMDSSQAKASCTPCFVPSAWNRV